MSISTSLRSSTPRRACVWAKQMTATSRISCPSHAVAASGLGRARPDPRAQAGAVSSPGMRTSSSGSPLGRNHLIDSRVGPSRRRRATPPRPACRCGPRRPGDLLDEVHDREVGAVEQDQGAGVRDLHGRAVELHVHHAERGDGADLGELDLARWWARRARDRRRGRHVDLCPRAACWPMILLLGDAPQEAGRGAPAVNCSRARPGVRTLCTGSTSLERLGQRDLGASGARLRRRRSRRCR